jgi:proteasome lid subunit RPN8/RPN11
MYLRVLEAEWTPFIDSLRARKDVETAGIILAERLHGGDVLLARHLMLVPDEGYRIRRVDQLRIDPVAINRLVRQGRECDLSVLTIHTHPGTSEPWFSRADDDGDSRLVPSLFAQMHGPHGSLVVAGETGVSTGRVWSESGGKTDLQVRSVGLALRVNSAAANREAGSHWFERQRLALGSEGQAVLRSLNVAVVGLGGTGSVTFAQLAHLGVGRITVVDDDRIEQSNVSRVFGARCRDAGVTWKVDVAARYSTQLDLGTSVNMLRGRLGFDVSTKNLEDCDVILSCVDKHTPRAILNRLAYEKAIPVIDMGSAFRVNSMGRVIAGAGRVVIVGPERRCLACWGHIDPSRLRIEALSADARAAATAEGYIEGVDVPQPSVVAFNTTIAGTAVIELLRLVTGFAGTDDPPMRLSFDFEAGTVRRNRLSDAGPCSICAPEGTSPARQQRHH